MSAPPANCLYVGLTEDGREVVVNHPQLTVDAEGNGHIVFSPEQARHLAELLLQKAAVSEGKRCAGCGIELTGETGWATARLSYCFKDACQAEFYAEAQAAIRMVDPILAETLRSTTAALAFTCPKCGAVSHNPNDKREGYCGRCHEFTGRKDA